MDEHARKPRPGRPRDLGKGERIIESAWKLFLTHGVEAVAVEVIAREAGVSKGTLYAAYPDKAALFAVCLQREMGRIVTAQGFHHNKPATCSLVETLQAFGVGIMTFLATETAVNFYGVLASELRRSPSLAESFWNIGPGATKGNLSRILQNAAADGEILVGDPDEAAELLIGAWQGLSNYRLALGLNGEGRDEEIAARVERGIQFFLRAYGPSSSSRG